MNKKMMMLSAMLLGGATLFEGCLNSFWQGLWRTGFSFGQGKWVDITLDILREDLFS
jgi:hypothetical protein